MQTARARVFLLLHHLIEQAENRILRKLDQGLEHLRFAGEMAVQRSLGDTYRYSQRCRGDPRARLGFEFACEYLKDLTLAVRFHTLLDKGSDTFVGK